MGLSFLSQGELGVAFSPVIPSAGCTPGPFAFLGLVSDRGKQTPEDSRLVYSHELELVVDKL